MLAVQVQQGFVTCSGEKQVRSVDGKTVLGGPLEDFPLLGRPRKNGCSTSSQKHPLPDEGIAPKKVQLEFVEEPHPGASGIFLVIGESESDAPVDAGMTFPVGGCWRSLYEVAPCLRSEEHTSELQ